MRKREIFTVDHSKLPEHGYVPCFKGGLSGDYITTDRVGTGAVQKYTLRARNRNSASPVTAALVYRLNMDGTANYFVVPEESIVATETASIMDLFQTALAKLMPGRFHIEESGLILLHYPELTIKNTMNQEHTIYDLIVTLYFEVNGRGEWAHLNSSIYGGRLSLTPRELQKGYRHSHLPLQTVTNPTSHIFCMGNGSAFSLFLRKVREFETLEDVELFLYQLEQFLMWESVEGTPYVYIRDLAELPKLTSFRRPVASSEGIRTKLADKLLKILPKEMLGSVGDKYFIDPSLAQAKMFELETELVASLTDTEKADLEKDFYDYYPAAMSYVSVASSVDNTTRLPSAISDPGDSSLRKAKEVFKITPSVKPDKFEVDRSVLIKRLSPRVWEDVFKKANEQLNVIISRGSNIEAQA